MTHHPGCMCLPCRLTELAHAEHHPASHTRAVRYLERLAGIAAYNAWRARQRPEVFA